MIELRNVSKWYGTFQVLRDCSTRVGQGEVVVVNDKFGIRLTDVVSAQERVRKLR